MIKAITLDPRLEQFLLTKVQRTPHDVGLVLDPTLALASSHRVNRSDDEDVRAGTYPYHHHHSGVAPRFQTFL